MTTQVFVKLPPVPDQQQQIGTTPAASGWLADWKTAARARDRTVGVLDRTSDGMEATFLDGHVNIEM